MLSVTLLDGFSNDVVVIHINGNEIFRKAEVTTRLLLGYAESFEVAAPEGTITLIVEVPTKNAKKEIPLEVTQPLYLYISLVSGELIYRVSQQPSGFM